MGLEEVFVIDSRIKVRVRIQSRGESMNFRGLGLGDNFNATLGLGSWQIDEFQEARIHGLVVTT